MALEKFCLCCKLRNGVVVFGIFGIILNLITFACLQSADIFYETIHDPNRNYVYNWRMNRVFWISLTILFINLISLILLVVGAVKKKHFLMLPWIVVHGIAAIPFALASAVLIIAGLPIYGPVYIWWCVCSAYQKVQEVPDVPYNKFDGVTLSDNLPNREVL